MKPSNLDQEIYDEILAIAELFEDKLTARKILLAKVRVTEKAGIQSAYIDGRRLRNFHKDMRELYEKRCRFNSPHRVNILSDALNMSAEQLKSIQKSVASRQ